MYRRAALILFFLLFVAPLVSFADPLSDLQLQVNSLLAELQALQQQLAALGGGVNTGARPPICSVQRDLKLGDSGQDVLTLQIFLHSKYPAAQEMSGTFGPSTKAALSVFQDQVGISAQAGGNGIFGSFTRAYIASHFCTAVIPPTPAPTTAPQSSIYTTFAAAPTSGIAPLTVTFRGSVGSVYLGGVTIDYGDGSSNVFCNAGVACQNAPSHIYASAGTYTARLIGNGQGGANLLGAVTIVVSAPTATLSISSPNSGTSVAIGGVLSIVWSSQGPPSGSQVRLEIYPTGASVIPGNNDRGLRANTSNLSDSGDANWTVSGDTSQSTGTGYGGFTITPGTYKIVAKLYAGSSCWGSGCSSSDRTIIATAESPSFTVTNSCMAPTNDLELGDTDADNGGDVSNLQRFLARSSSIYPEGLVTGFFGRATERAVKRYQASKGILQTGFVGPLTRTAISADCSGKTVSNTPYAFTIIVSTTTPGLVTFRATAVETFGSDIWYSVNFGDGNTGTMAADVGATSSVSVQHTYTSNGTYITQLLQNDSLCGAGITSYGCLRSLIVDTATTTVGSAGSTGTGGTQDTSGGGGSCTQYCVYHIDGSVAACSPKNYWAGLGSFARSVSVPSGALLHDDMQGQELQCVSGNWYVSGRAYGPSIGACRGYDGTVYENGQTAGWTLVGPFSNAARLPTSFSSTYVCSNGVWICQGDVRVGGLGTGDSTCPLGPQYQPL